MAEKRSTNMEVRKRNRNNIYRFIRRAEVTSNPDISYALKISLPTVTQNTRELIEQGLVEETGKLESTGGKRAAALAVAAGFRLAAGLNITRNHISLVLVDLKGALLECERTVLPFVHEERYYQKVNDLLEQFLEKWNVDREKVLGIGISLPGIVDLKREEISYSHVLKVEAVPFSYISSFFSYPCSFLNDANAGAYAEGICQESEDRFFYLSLSSTVGGGIYSGSELVQGKEYRCGEVGHLTIVPDGDPCYCGKKGCLDVYCSSARLSELAGGSLERFFQGLEQGEKRFAKAWDTYTSYLSVALDNIRMVLDCEIVIGGYVGGFIGKHIEDVYRKVSERNIFEKRGTYVRPCVFRQEAAALGAALSVTEAFVAQI